MEKTLSNIQRLFIDFLDEKWNKERFEKNIKDCDWFNDLEELLSCKHGIFEIDPASWVEEAFDWSMKGESFELWQKIDIEWQLRLIGNFKPEWTDALNGSYQLMSGLTKKDFPFYRKAVYDVALALLIKTELYLIRIEPQECKKWMRH